MAAKLIVKFFSRPWGPLVYVSIEWPVSRSNLCILSENNPCGGDILHPLFKRFTPVFMCPERRKQ